ncbi:MAG: triose-phosphate isomerase [Candidatus Wildermuthbacteria bacterium]|nr:triose-phosphate isomerase [Candidatus Wildermuthbacteria bacterium]
MSKLIVANWKCNPSTLEGAKLLFDSVASGTKDIKNSEVVICPPLVYLSVLKANGAQDCFWEKGGAYTGEISPEMLKNLGCQYVILGHSERRKFLGETDEMINKKVKAALSAGLKPILCVGNSKQLKNGLKGIENWKLKIENLVVAYEPVWAISTTKGGSPATVENVLNGAAFIKEAVEEARIIYGGSVDSKNVNGYILKAKMDGVLVGQASLDSKEFIKIIEAVK